MTTEIHFHTFLRVTIDLDVLIYCSWLEMSLQEKDEAEKKLSDYKSKLCFCLCSQYSDTKCMGYPLPTLGNSPTLWTPTGCPATQLRH